MLAAVACASLQPETQFIQLRWPEPPEVTRVEFVRTIRWPEDVKGGVSKWDATSVLLGISSQQEGKAIVQPADLAVSPDGSLVYLSDFAEGVIHVFDFVQGTTRYFGLQESFSRPFGLALDAAGRLWVVEQSAPRIRVVDANGATVKTIESERLVRPIGIALDEARGLLYVADGARQNSTAHFVHVFDLDGKFLRDVGSGRGTDPGHLLFPTYLELDPEGRLFVSDTMNSRISVFDAEGNFLRVIGGRGDTVGSFDKPKGLAFDGYGNLYVVDSSWSNVQIFGPRDDVLLYFGGRGGYPGLLRNPTAIAISRSNHIFVGDYLNRRMNVYRLLNTVAGDGMPAGQSAAQAAAPPAPSNLPN